MDASYGWNPYAEHGVYDMDLDYGAGPSRPVPQPYDDPYSDAYNQLDSVGTSTATPQPARHPRPERGPGRVTSQGDLGPGQGRDGQRTYHHRERGRGRGRGWGHDRGRGRGRGRGGVHGQGREGHATAPPRRTEDRGVHGPRPLSPTSAVIAQATGRYLGGSEYTPFSPQLPQFGFAQAYSPSPVQQQQQFMSPQHAVQPHINPRFAVQFGLNMEMMQQQQQPGQQYLTYSSPYGTPTTPVYESGWDGQWSQDSGYGAEHSHVKPEHDHNS
jgi:H/ACA ribonucleoprotein complex non-core subunit NAF1